TELLAPDGMVGIGITLTTDTAGSSTWAAAVLAARKRIKIARNHRIEPPDTVAALYFLRLRAIAPALRGPPHRHIGMLTCQRAGPHTLRCGCVVAEHRSDLGFQLRDREDDLPVLPSDCLQRRALHRFIGCDVSRSENARRGSPDRRA